MTGLGDGSRISKADIRIQAIGEVDELNSSLGVLLAETIPSAIRMALEDIQHDLFDLGGALCLPDRQIMRPEQVARLEALVETFNHDLPKLKEFIIPGGTRPSALCQLSRAICRRAERAVVTLCHHENDAKTTTVDQQYLNRLSDLLFIIARVLNRSEGRDDILWEKKERST